MAGLSPDSGLAALVSILRDGAPHSGEEAGRRLGITRAAVQKRMVLLRRLGYRFSARAGTGYRLISATERPLPWEVFPEWGMGNGEWRMRIGRRMLYFTSTASTNIMAMEAGRAGADEGLVLVAERQASGRGRLGRRWLTLPGSLAFSIILRPPVPLSGTQPLALLAGLVVAGAIGEATGLRPALKWPNDVLVNGRKVCGILTEVSGEADAVNFAVIGAGINVNAAALPPALARTATSLRIESGHPVNRAALLRAILQRFNRDYMEWLSAPGEVNRRTAEEHNRLSAIIGKEVRVTVGKEAVEGVAEGVDDSGALVVRPPSGEVRRIDAGECEMLRGQFSAAALSRRTRRTPRRRRRCGVGRSPA